MKTDYNIGNTVWINTKRRRHEQGIVTGYCPTQLFPYEVTVHDEIYYCSYFQMSEKKIEETQRTRKKVAAA